MQPVIRVFRLAFNLYSWRGVERQRDIGLCATAEFDPCVRLEHAEELVGLQEQRIRRQQGPVFVSLHQPMSALGVVPEALHGGLNLAVQYQNGVLT